MNLYHYSSQLLDVLKTKREQNVLTPKQIEEAERQAKIGKLVGAYCDHISFFFERIPLDIQSAIYGNDHPVWFQGNKLYEYEVPVLGLPDFKYDIVETPKKTALYYDESLTIPAYRRKLEALIKAEGYQGKGATELIKALKPLIGTTRECVAKANSYPNWEQIKNKYAANVPHVMIYPTGGLVRFANVRQIIIP